LALSVLVDELIGLEQLENGGEPLVRLVEQNEVAPELPDEHGHLALRQRLNLALAHPVKAAHHLRQRAGDRRRPLRRTVASVRHRRRRRMLHFEVGQRAVGSGRAIHPRLAT